MALAAARRDKPAAAARTTAARPSKALTARAPLQKRVASRPRALLRVLRVFRQQAARQQVLPALRVFRQQAARQQVLPALRVLRAPVPLVLPQQALGQKVLPALPVLPLRVPRRPVLPLPPAPRQQALQAQRVPLFRLLPVLRCLAP